jgi:hypothetical protein
VGWEPTRILEVGPGLHHEVLADAFDALPVVDEDPWLIIEVFLPKFNFLGNPGVCHLVPPFGDIAGGVDDCQPFAIGASVAIIGESISGGLIVS